MQSNSFILNIPIVRVQQFLAIYLIGISSNLLKLCSYLTMPVTATKTVLFPNKIPSPLTIRWKTDFVQYYNSYFNDRRHVKKKLSSLFSNANVNGSIKYDDGSKGVVLKIPSITWIIFSNEQWCTFVSVNNKINTPEVSMALNKYYNSCQRVLLFRRNNWLFSIISLLA